MKQSDIITVVIIAVVGVIVSAFACNAILGDPDEASVRFETVEPIQSDLAQPDSEVFNTSALNPTVEVYVGNCEDVDQNGTLDSSELLACGGEAEEVEGNENSESTDDADAADATSDEDDEEDEE